jgi:hypothetical protein
MYSPDGRYRKYMQKYGREASWKAATEQKTEKKVVG